MGKRLILKASAGTGKTYRLSLEYIGALLTGTDYREILVMTFTRKATSEIKERIIGFLQGICNDIDMYNEIEKNLQNIYGDDFKIDRDRIKVIYHDILENRDRLRIYTIDAFTNLLFKKIIAPYLKLYKYEIVDDTENHKILVETFQRLFESKDSFEMFKEFLEENSEKDMANYISLIKNLMEERWKFIAIGETLLNREKVFDYEDIGENVDRFISLAERIAHLKGKDLPEIFKVDFKELCEIEDKNEYIFENYNLFLSKEPWNANKIKSTKALNIDAEREKMFKSYEDIKVNLAKNRFNKKVMPYEKKIIKVITKIYEIYDEIKLREKKFTYSDISNYTFKYLHEPELGFIGEDGKLTEEFFDVIDGKITSIFIDEFQDTSILQWKILKNIIEKSRDIICVGDEKQSIYGWRGGEKRLFENLEMNIDGETEILGKCFRSRENIVKYINKVFLEIALSTQGQYIYNRDWNYEEVDFVEKDEKGYVEVIVGDEENDALDLLIKNITTKFNGNYNGIGIIARTRKTLQGIGEKLGELEIPYTFEEQTNIYETKSTFPIYSLIRWMVKGDYLSLLDFLRSDVVGISTSTLKELIEKREKVEKWLKEKDENEIEIECQPLEIVKDLYQTFLENRGATYCLIYEMIVRLGVLERYTTKEDSRDVFNFYKLLREYKYFSDFLAEVDENPDEQKFRKSNTKSEGISLLTIHKSKGLEFDTVFYFIPKQRNHGGNKGMQTFFKIDEKYDKTVDFLVTHSKFNCVLENIEEITYLEESSEKETLEEINNLYVALTRPKKNLFVVIEDIETAVKQNLMPLLISEPVGNIVVEELEKEEEEKKSEGIPIDFCGNEKKYKLSIEENYTNGREKIKTHDLVVEYKRLKGNAVHFFLENLNNWSKEEINGAKKLTFSKFASIVGKNELEKIFSEENLIKLEKQCWELFSDKWDYIYKEHTIYYRNEETDEIEVLRLDRLMIKKSSENSQGIIFIADYKTGKHNEEQIKKYEKAIIQYLYNNKIDIKNYKIVSKYIELEI